MFTVLSKAFAFIGNDSGPMHVSAMLGKPTLGIFGSTHPSWTGPIGPNANYIYVEEECSPCYKRVCPLVGQEHMKCMTQISASEIVELFDKIIK